MAFQKILQYEVGTIPLQDYAFKKQKLYVHFIKIQFKFVCLTTA